MSKNSKNLTLAFANNDIYTSRFMVESLCKSGFTIVLCRNAGDLLPLFDPSVTKKPDILISDCFLAHGDEFCQQQTKLYTRTGIEVYVTLRKNYRNLPVILHTTDGRDLEVLKTIKDPNLVVLDATDLNMRNNMNKAVRKMLNIH